MNKKIKNIASVVQTKSAAVLCTLCAVLFLASCNDESLVDNPHAQNAFRTVSVDLGMPQGKPAYGDGTDSRAQMADTTATGYRLSFDTAETGKPDASRAGSNNWIDGDRLLLHIVASNKDQTTQTTEGMLTLTYSDSKWSLDAVNSYTKYGASFVAYNSAQPKLLITDDDTNIDLANLKMHVDEKIGMSANVTATLVYAPHMKWRLTEGSVTLVVDETASTYEKWEWTNTNTNSSWTTPYARLRVNTGAAGDVVTLTSSAFDSAWEVEPTEGEGENAKTVYTATTDTLGNAYFYGITNGTLTANFLVELTQMRVPVPTAAPTSEGRSITLVDESTLLIDLDEPITLLEASDVVPVMLTATHAYRIEANVKREAAKGTAIANLSLIDGSVGGKTSGTAEDVAAVKAQIETAMAMDITEFTVINQLATYSAQDNMFAGTVVGEAIMQLVSISEENNNMTFDTTDSEYGSISLVLRDATTVPNGAFQYCAALQSVMLNEVTQIGNNAFLACSALESATLNEVTEIGNNAFFICVALENVTLDKVTSIGEDAFYFCSSLTSIESDAVLQVGMTAFSECTELTAVNLPNATQIDKSAFLNCSKLTTVNMPNVTSLGSCAFESTALTNLTLGKVTEVDAGDNQYTITFNHVNTDNCDLTLHAEQQETEYPVTAKGGKLIWADEEWQSITVGETVYTAVGDVLCSSNNGVPTIVIGDVTYAVIDGQCGKTEADESGNYNGTDQDVANVKAQIETAMDMNITDFIVVNQLARYNSDEAETVVGEAINDLASDRNSPNYGTISITIADATELLSASFYECHALKSVTFNKKVSLQGYGHFDGCTALESVTFMESDNTIGLTVFQGCTKLTGIPWDKVTSIEQKAFQGCTLTGTVNLSQLTSVNAAAFQGAIVSDCDLVLPAGQESNVTVSNDGKLMWAGAQWKSITLLDGPNGTAGTKYYIDNGMPTVEIDGTCGITGDNPIGEDTHVSAMKLKIKVVADAANADAPAKVIVKNGLASFGALPRTVVGQAIHDLASNEESSNYGTISITIADATELPSGAFFECYALESVTFNKTVVIGKAAFSNCTALESVKFIGSGNTIGEAAFRLCVLTGIDWTKVTKIDGAAFWNCTLTGMVDLSQVTTVVDDAFQFANVSNCDLVLPAGQESNVDVSNDGKLMWAYGEGWNSITVGGVQYKAVGNELYAVIDGSVGGKPQGDNNDVNTVKAQIQAVPANTKILVTNGLAAYTKENPTPTDIYAGTVVGEAIRLLTSQAMPTNTSEEDYIVSISLVLDDGITEIPYIAFRGCKELGSVVANGVTTIGIGAFYECTGIKELTFGQTFNEVGMDAFGLDRRENDYCWSNNCVLTLKSGQLLLTSGSLPNKYTSQGYEQVQEGNDKPWCDTAWKVIKLVSNTPQPI